MFSDKAKRFFHAASDRKGMDAEADHKGKCMSCGGSIDARGMALGGDVDDENRRPLEEESEPYEGQDPENDDGETTQMESEDDLAAKARKAFVRAVRSR